MHRLSILCGAAALAAMLAVPAASRADEYNKETRLTFSGPVQVPGQTLAAGTYVFKLADSNDRHIVQIFDKDNRHLITTVMSRPDQRYKVTDKPVIMFKEAPAGMPPAIQAWFYPGREIGDEFVYPRKQAMLIARATHVPVLSMDDNAKASDMKNAKIGRVGENGEPADETATTTAEAAPEPAPAPSTTGTTGDAAPAPVHRARLPQTASPLALYELISGLAFAGAFGIRRFAN